MLKNSNHIHLRSQKNADILPIDNSHNEFNTNLLKQADTDHQTDKLHAITSIPIEEKNALQQQERKESRSAKEAKKKMFFFLTSFTSPRLKNNGI